MTVSMNGNEKRALRLFEGRVGKILLIPTVLAILSMAGLGVEQILGAVAEKHAAKVIADSTFAFRTNMSSFMNESEADRKRLHDADKENKDEIVKEMRDQFLNLNIRLDRAKFPK